MCYLLGQYRCLFLKHEFVQSILEAIDRILRLKYTKCVINLCYLFQFYLQRTGKYHNAPFVVHFNCLCGFIVLADFGEGSSVTSIL